MPQNIISGSPFEAAQKASAGVYGPPTPFEVEQRNIRRQTMQTRQADMRRRQALRDQEAAANPLRTGKPTVDAGRQQAGRRASRTSGEVVAPRRASSGATEGARLAANRQPIYGPPKPSRSVMRDARMRGPMPGATRGATSSASLEAQRLASNLGGPMHGPPTPPRSVMRAARRQGPQYGPPTPSRRVMSSARQAMPDYGPPTPSRRVMSSARRARPEYGPPTPSARVMTRESRPLYGPPAPVRPMYGPPTPTRSIMRDVRRTARSDERVAQRVARGAESRTGREALGKGLEFAGKHKGVIAGGIGLALGVGALLRNQGPGVSGNGYMPTGSSSGGGGYR